MVTIATWNVNSIKARLPQFLRYASSQGPDILLLQELKCIDEAFPRAEIEDLGYNVATSGQKTYNGVAILSKFPIEDVVKILPGDESDEQARYIEAVISADNQAIRVASVYVPNGQEVGSDKFAYKMNFFDRLYQHIKELLSYEEVMVIGGDYNVAPTDLDVYDPKSLAGTVCFHPDEQEKFFKLCHLGLAEAFRAKNPHTQQFSWWDYRSGGWQNNKGMRIDHLLLSPEAIDILDQSGIHAEIRGEEKSSDHVPVWCELKRG